MAKETTCPNGCVVVEIDNFGYCVACGYQLVKKKEKEKKKKKK